MKYFYQVLSTPTADSPGSTFVLHYPGRKYVFGHVSEGTQRVVVESGTSITHLTDFFVTGRTTWANYGGTLGMLLTIADSRSSAAAGIESELQKKAARKGPSVARPEPARAAVSDLQQDMCTRLTIHGGRNVNHMLATARRFIFRKSVPIAVKEYDSASLARETEPSRQTDPFEEATYSDENIKVWAMSLKPSYELRFESRAGFRSPRKRSLNEMEEGESEQSTTSDPKIKDQLLREQVVKDMFDSDWKLDALFEEDLPTVKMPAAIFTRNPNTKDLERYTGPLPGGPDPVPDIKVFVRKPWPAARIERLPATSQTTESICYFVRSRDQRGKFDPKKAIALGVPPGPIFTQLTLGQNYTTKDGTVVTPEMVLGPTRPGKSVAFIDLPSTLYIDDLISRPEWQSPTLTDSLSTVFWILGPGVGEDPRIIDFVSRMKKCEHLVSSTDHCPNHLTMLTATKSALRLAKINNDNFVVPVHDNVMLPQMGTRPESPKADISSSQKLPWRSSQPGLTLDMEPNFGFNESTIIPELNTRSFVARMPKAVQQRLSVIRQRLRKHAVIDKVMEMRKGLPELAMESEVITLGTGSSSPSKYRNVSATLLNVPGKGYYLFDCGENTLGQLKRVFQPEELREVMRNLRMIWVSHLHADHHLGAVSVIKEWYEVNYGPERLGERTGSGPVTEDMTEILKQNRLCVISESNFIQWLEEYASVEKFGFDKLLPLSVYKAANTEERFKSVFAYRHAQPDGTFKAESPRTTIMRFDDRSSPLSELLRQATGLEDVRTVLVSHCRGAMAVTLEWEGGFIVSYSGDCRPSKNFTEIGKDSTLLIHEATFQDDLRGQARAKRHSTAAEAISVGRLMNAKMVILTHFSQRYAKISRLEESGKSLLESSNDPRSEYTQRMGTLDVPDEDWPGGGGMDIPSNDDLDIGTSMINDAQNRARSSPMPVCMAFDYMKVRIRDIPIAQMFSPAFEKLIERLEQAADEENLELREKQLAALQAKNPKKFGKGKKNGDNKDKSQQKSPSRSASTERKKKSAWSASESESGWSDESDIEQSEKM